MGNLWIGGLVNWWIGGLEFEKGPSAIHQFTNSPIHQFTNSPILVSASRWRRERFQGATMARVAGDLRRALGRGITDALQVLVVDRCSHQDHLAGDRVDDVIEREAPLFGSHLRVIDHLEEEVAKLVLERLEILAGDRSATS